MSFVDKLVKVQRGGKEWYAFKQGCSGMVVSTLKKCMFRVYRDAQYGWLFACDNPDCWRPLSLELNYMVVED